MPKVTLNVKSITILTGIGTDEVVLHIEGPTSYPNLSQLHPTEDYSPSLHVKVQKGYSEEWLREMGLGQVCPIESINTHC